MVNKDFKLLHADKIIVDGVVYAQAGTMPNEDFTEIITSFFNEKQFEEKVKSEEECGIDGDFEVDSIQIRQPYYDISKC